MMPTEGTTRRSVRVEDAIWDAAKQAAHERGDNLSEIIRAALRAYIDKWEKK